MVTMSYSVFDDCSCNERYIEIHLLENKLAYFLVTYPWFWEPTYFSGKTDGLPDNLFLRHQWIKRGTDIVDLTSTESIDIERRKNRLLKFCYVPTTSAAHNRLLFLLRSFTVPMKQTRQSALAIKQSIFLDVYDWERGCLDQCYKTFCGGNSCRGVVSYRVCLFMPSLIFTGKSKGLTFRLYLRQGFNFSKLLCCLPVLG
jgi:hypothetical protein